MMPANAKSACFTKMAELMRDAFILSAARRCAAAYLAVRRPPLSCLRPEQPQRDIAAQYGNRR